MISAPHSFSLALLSLHSFIAFVFRVIIIVIPRACFWPVKVFRPPFCCLLFLIVFFCLPFCLFKVFPFCSFACLLRWSAIFISLLFFFRYSHSKENCRQAENWREEHWNVPGELVLKVVVLGNSVFNSIKLCFTFTFSTFTLWPFSSLTLFSLRRSAARLPRCRSSACWMTPTPR